MTASDPVTIPGDRTALAREAGLGRLLLPSMLGTSGTFREGSTNRVAESTRHSRRCRSVLDKVELAGRSLAAGGMAPLARSATVSLEALSRCSLSGSGVGQRHRLVTAGDRYGLLLGACMGTAVSAATGRGRMEQRRRTRMGGAL
jgi:hypothetical protein